MYLDFGNNEREEINTLCNFVSGELSEDNNNDSKVAQEIDDNSAKSKDGRLVEKIVIKNVINLSEKTNKVRNFASFKRN